MECAFGERQNHDRRHGVRKCVRRNGEEQIRLRSAQLGGLALGALAVAAYFLVAATVGFSGPPARWEQYGEVPVAGLVRQPICFWTDLGFIIAGIFALRKRPFGLGFLIVWMGPASMLEHGTLTTTWGWFDATSIHWFALNSIAVLAGRRLVSMALAVAAATIGALTFFRENWRAPVTQALLAAVIVAALATLIARRAARDVWILFAATLTTFALATGFLLTGANLTAPWGHGAWHLFSAIAMVFAAELIGRLSSRQ